MFDFQTQLKVGNQGEDFFLKCYSSINARKADGREIDLYVGKNMSVELKSDSYPMTKTENFFMELYGNLKTKPLAGPWRSLRDDVYYFTYLFLTDNTFFWFRPATLCKFLDMKIKYCEPKYIKNKGWTGMGYLIKRDDVQHLCLQQDAFDSEGKLLASVRHGKN